MKNQQRQEGMSRRGVWDSDKPEEGMTKSSRETTTSSSAPIHRSETYRIVTEGGGLCVGMEMTKSTSVKLVGD